jgi:(p)ppGpp synthase/HD superfamily hydrolase
MFRYWQARRAEDIAYIAHKGQKRRGTEKDYIEHPKAIVQRMKDNGIDNKLYHAVAWLHDVLEDTKVTAEELEQKGIASSVLKAVELLTKKKNKTYKEYLSELKKNEMARTVKIYDMIENLSDRPTEKQIKKYARGLAYLTE